MTAKLSLRAVSCHLNPLTTSSVSLRSSRSLSICVWTVSGNFNIAHNTRTFQDLEELRILCNILHLCSLSVPLIVDDGDSMILEVDHGLEEMSRQFIVRIKSEVDLQSVGREQRPLWVVMLRNEIKGGGEQPQMGFFYRIMLFCK
jgi:hypothetical protein